jgi:Tfp pilus assembly protein PilF
VVHLQTYRRTVVTYGLSHLIKEDPMPHKMLTSFAVFFVLVSFMSCESSQTGGGSKKAGTSADAPLFAPASTAARADNDEGVGHYQQGHWDVAKKHFMEAAKADPQSAEAHYNLALTLDKSGDHKGATEHFMKAHDLGKDNAEIQNSEILKGHLKAMKH